MNNRQKLEKLLLDVFLLEPEEFSWELTREQIDTWDSLGIVSLAVGIQETLGYHMTPDEATSVSSVKSIIQLLETKGIKLDE